MTGSYNNFFRYLLPTYFFSSSSMGIFKLPFSRMFDRSSRKEVTLEASREVAKPKTMLKPRKVFVFAFISLLFVIAKPKAMLKPRKKTLVSKQFVQVCSGGKRKKDEISVDCLDFNKKILHTAWHPQVGFFFQAELSFAGVAVVVVVVVGVVFIEQYCI